MTGSINGPSEAFLAEMEDIRDQRRSWLMLEYHVADSGEFVIDLISVDQPRQGLGSEIMQHIVDHADEHGVVIELEASWHGGRNIRQKKLEKWYRRFDFGLTGAASASGNPVMRRRPRNPGERNMAA